MWLVGRCERGVTERESAVPVESGASFAVRSRLGIRAIPAPKRLILPLARFDLFLVGLGLPAPFLVLPSFIGKPLGGAPLGPMNERNQSQRDPGQEESHCHRPRRVALDQPHDAHGEQPPDSKPNHAPDRPGELHEFSHGVLSSVGWLGLAGLPESTSAHKYGGYLTVWLGFEWLDWGHAAP